MVNWIDSKERCFGDERIHKTQGSDQCQTYLNSLVQEWSPTGSDTLMSSDIVLMDELCLNRSLLPSNRHSVYDMGAGSSPYDLPAAAQGYGMFERRLRNCQR